MLLSLKREDLWTAVEQDNGVFRGSVTMEWQWRMSWRVDKARELWGVFSAKGLVRYIPKAIVCGGSERGWVV
jgi:hypothetical protein